MTFQVLVPKIHATSNIVTDATATTNTAWTNGTYATGVQRYYDQILYQVSTNVTNTSNQPPHADWIAVEYINPYKMFDQKQGSQTQKTGSGTNSNALTVTVTSDTVCNGCAILNIDATTLSLTVTDSVEGEVYSYTETLLEDVFTWWEYFFSAYDVKSDVYLDDLPAYTNAQYKLILSKSQGNVYCGEYVLGQYRAIGYTQFGATASIIDYSKKEADAYGNYSIDERTYSKRADFDLQIETTELSTIYKILSGIRATPCVYAGDSTQGAMIVYGFFRDFSVILSSPSLSECTISVEGL